MLCLVCCCYTVDSRYIAFEYTLRQWKILHFVQVSEITLQNIGKLRQNEAVKKKKRQKNKQRNSVIIK